MAEYRVVIEGRFIGEDLRRLTQWLRDDELVGDEAHVALSSAPSSPADMGTAFDAIQLTVDSGFQVANLVLAIAVWRGSRSNPPTVAIERNGTRVTVDSDDPAIVARIAAALADE
jgi:adenosine deaminase